MFIDTTDIRDEFNELTSFNFSSNKSIGALCQTFESDENVHGFSMMTMAQKPRAFGMNDSNKIKEFSLYLMEFGNIDYCRKLAVIGRAKAVKIIHILNEAASKRGLEPVYIFKPKNLHANKIPIKRVQIIKYLLHKGYSGHRLGKIYDISQSTVNLIKNNVIHKDVQPIININVKQKDTVTLPYLHSPEESTKYFHYIIWENTPTCPHCKNTAPYLTSREHVYRCSNSQCKRDFRATVKSVFDNSKLKPGQWLCAMHLFNADQNISTHRLAQQIGCTQKTGWNVKERLKEAYCTPIWQRFYLLNNTVN